MGNSLKSYRFAINCRPLLQILFFMVIAALLNCTDNNPFKDEANARAVIKSDIQNGDTLQIFSTKSLTVDFMVRNLLQKCSLCVEGNRFFRDSCIDFNKLNSFRCDISFYDTGHHQIKLVSVRESGEIIHQSISVFVVSPLFQPDIAANVGDSVLLCASRVDDMDVLYNWRFSDGEVVISDTAAVAYKLRGTSGPQAMLTVSDRKGKYCSPPVRFSCLINDTVAPVITCLNDLRKDTVIAFDSNFYFIVRVDDEGGVKNATCNNIPPDKVFPYHNYREFVWLIKGVSTLPLPRQLNITAADEFGNLSSKRFWLCYDSTGTSSGQVYFKISSPTSPTIKKRHFYLSGEVVNFLNSQSGLLSLIVDSVASDTWDFADKISGKWNFNVSIKNDRNNCSIRLLLTSIDGEALADTGFQVFYDPYSEDSKKPNMVELTVNGQPVTVNGERKIVDKSPALLRLIAFDEGDGISSVTINGDTVHKSDSIDFIWEKELFISTAGDDFTIKVTDSANHDSSMLFFLKLNHRPELFDYQNAIEAVVGKMYSGYIHALDRDGDDIVYKPIDPPVSFMIDSLSGNFTWTPEISDTAVSRILISYGDKHWVDMVCTLDVIVQDSQRVYQTLMFDTSKIKIPQELIADSQVLRIQLKTIPAIDDKQLRYDARLIPGGSPLQISDGWLRWTPVEKDTGIQKLFLTVTDILNDSFATFFAQIRVLPNRAPVHLSLAFCKGQAEVYNLSDPSLCSTVDIFVHDSSGVLKNSDKSITIKYCGKTEYKLPVQNRASIILDAMAKDSGYDTLYVSIVDRNKTLIEKRCLYFGTAPNKPVFIAPSDGQMINSDEYRFSWSGGDVDTANKVRYFLYLAWGSNDFYLAESVFVDTQCMVRLDKAGIYKCKIVAFDGKTSVESDIINIDVEPQSRVKFKNTMSDFPFYIETGDTWSIQLVPQSGTGTPPYTYNISSSGNSAPVIIQGANQYYATLNWAPSAGDTGTYKLRITISDSLKNADFLEPVIRIVPPNRPATVSCSWADSVLDMRETSLPETLSFSIEDPDDPVLEKYSILVKLGLSERLLSIGETRQFTVILEKNGNLKDEFLEIKIFDQGVWRTDYRLHIYYSD